MNQPVVDLSVPPLAVLHQRRSRKWTENPPDVLSMTVAEMDFPVATPIRQALMAAVNTSDFGYATAQPVELSRTLAEFARRRLNWAIDPSQVTVMPDVMVGLLELCRAVTGPGEALAFATPNYPPYFHELGTEGRRVVTIPMHPDWTLDLEALERALEQGIKAFVLTNPHNPTGHLLSHGELAAIAKRCAAAEVWVFADEVHAPLTLPGATHVPWLSVSDEARSCGVALTSASKAFNLAALKMAFIVTAGERPRQLVQRLGPQQGHVGLLGEIAALAAFGDGDAWLDALIAQLDHNRRLLAEELAEQIPEITWIPPQGSYLAWLNCQALGLGDDPAAAFLERGRVALAPGLDYGAPGAGHVRLNFATSPEHLSDAVRRMRRALDG